MPKFSKRSLSHLSECHEDLQMIAHEAIKQFDFVVYEGHRPKEEQDKAYFSKKSKVKWPNSKHNSKPSSAFDAAPYPINWNRTSSFYYMAGVMITIANRLYSEGKITHLLRWGGDWDRDTDLHDQTFMDLPHYELYKP